MGQVVGHKAMSMAIEKAKKSGIAMVTVRNSNHYGIAGYYAKMACDAGLIGMSFTNTNAIMVPTYGRMAMLGTNPIAFAMPADPTPFSFDAATTVVPRGKLEVYVKRGNGLPVGWALDENGHDSDDADRVLKNIIAKTGGGILPLGGCGEMTSGYKGYGFAMLCEIATAIPSGGTTSNYIYKTPGRANIAHCFIALDYGMFGDKAQIEANLSKYLQEVRDSNKAEGQEKIYYVPGENRDRLSKLPQVETLSKRGFDVLLFTDDVALALEEDYPVYASFVQMPGVNDTVQVYVLTTIVEQLNTDARNMRHLFPYNSLVQTNVLPSGLDRTEQNAFYRCLAQRVNNTYPTIDSFVNAVVSDTTSMSTITQLQQQCANDLFGWQVDIVEIVESN